MYTGTLAFRRATPQFTAVTTCMLDPFHKYAFGQAAYVGCMYFLKLGHIWRMDLGKVEGVNCIDLDVEFSLVSGRRIHVKRLVCRRMAQWHGDWTILVTLHSCSKAVEYHSVGRLVFAPPMHRDMTNPEQRKGCYPHDLPTRSGPGNPTHSRFKYIFSVGRAARFSKVVRNMSCIHISLKKR
jgi:hypothetical protein